MFKFFKKIFKAKQNNRKHLNEYINPMNGQKIYSSLVKDRHNARFLELEDSDVALIMHKDHITEVVLTKAKNENQSITKNEDLLMSLALFLKQPEFCEMLTSMFHDLAMKKLGPYATERNKTNE